MWLGSQTRSRMENGLGRWDWKQNNPWETSVPHHCPDGEDEGLMTGWIEQVRLISRWNSWSADQGPDSMLSKSEPPGQLLWEPLALPPDKGHPLYQIHFSSWNFFLRTTPTLQFLFWNFLHLQKPWRHRLISNLVSLTCIHNCLPSAVLDHTFSLSTHFQTLWKPTAGIIPFISLGLRDLMLFSRHLILFFDPLSLH